jgi:hypothetical protein
MSDDEKILEVLEENFNVLFNEWLFPEYEL